MKRKQFKEKLFRKYIENKADEKELEAFFHLCGNDDVQDELSVLMDEVWEKLDDQKVPVKKNVPFRVARIWPWAAAAAVLFLGIYLISPYSPFVAKSNSKISYQENTVLPGKKLGFITLPSGKSIDLSSVKSGVVLRDNKISYSDGTLISTADAESHQGIMTISTPSGGTYDIEMSDGSKVILNAATTLSFDSDFNNHKERLVSLSGQAYFQVAKNIKPFVVKSKGQTVSVLGTHFDVNAYGDEKYHFTTLVEGSVRINGVMLQPDEQASQLNGRITVRKVDAKLEAGWKDGVFIFHNEPLENIMKKISRWYNVDISFERDELKYRTFSGSFSRYGKIQELLNALKYTGIKSRLAGRKIYIIK